MDGTSAMDRDLTFLDAPGIRHRARQKPPEKWEEHRAELTTMYKTHTLSPNW